MSDVDTAKVARALPWGNSIERWGIVQQVLHWTIAALVALQLVVGNFFLIFEEGKPPPPLLPLHVQVGTLIGTLMLVRVLWRLCHPVPPLPPTLNGAQRALARFSHGALYGLIFAQFVVGYFLEDTFGARVGILGLDLPSLIGEKQGVPVVFGKIHKWIGFAIVTILALHVAGALAHEFVFKDNVLRRMTPLKLRPGRDEG
jgi:cytochrome b561